MKTGAALLTRGEDRGIKGGEVTFADIVDQGLPLHIDSVVEYRAPDNPSGDPADGRMEGGDANRGSGQCRDGLQGGINIFFSWGMAGKVHC